MKTANLSKRTLAALLDVAIISIIKFILINFLLINSWQVTIYDSENSSFAISISFLTILLYWLYYGFFDSNLLNGSIGKRLFKISVINQNNKNHLSLLDSFIRSTLRILSFILLLSGFIYAFFNEKRKTLHDLIIDTIVVDNIEILESKKTI
jgi:uncharacterized RDD family membrane protein YckC